ncbi:hypothetical protein AB0H34_38550, partial [Saccharopolyspora shandongensis]|uniref:hypothetical protein n=1 Tax=Saccharopolyspora shandongensis TaxID=418495 RepID=UPI0033DE244F
MTLHQRRRSTLIRSQQLVHIIHQKRIQPAGLPSMVDIRRIRLGHRRVTRTRRTSLIQQNI